MDATDLTALTAAEIAARVHDGRCSAVDIARAYLARIVERDPDLGAFGQHCPDRVLVEAEYVDRRADRFALPLAGVPVAIEDGVDVAGYRTGHGRAAEPARRDDELVRRLRRAGAVVVGKTRGPELAAGGASGSAPGGPGEGTALAVATGMAALALGTDDDGSIRLSAAGYGLVGLKPGAGVVPLPGGAEEDRCGLSAAGPIARTAQDAALMFHVLRSGGLDGERPGPGGGPVDRRPGGRRDGGRIEVRARAGGHEDDRAEVGTSRAGRPAAATPRTSGLRTDDLGTTRRAQCAVPPDLADETGPCRIALSLRSPTLFGRLRDDDRAAAIGAAARLRAGPGGAVVVLADPPYPRGLAARWGRRRSADTAREAALRDVGPGRTARRAAAAVRRDRYARRDRRAMTAWRERALHWFDDGRFDLLVCPVTAGEPWWVSPPHLPAGGPVTRAWNLAGLPALAAPVLIEGRTVGVQLVGRPGTETALLAAAARLEQRVVPKAEAARRRSYA